MITLALKTIYLIVRNRTIVITKSKKSDQIFFFRTEETDEVKTIIFYSVIRITNNFFITVFFVGNKGAVGVSFNIGTTSFCFVNSHLTSGTEKLKRYG